MSAPPFGVRTYSKVVPKEPPPDSFFQDCNSEKLQHSIVKYQFDGGKFGHWFFLHQDARQTDKLKGLRCAVQIDTCHCLLRGAYFIPSYLDEMPEKEKKNVSNSDDEKSEDENEEVLESCRKVIIPKLLMTNSVNSTRVYSSDFDYEQDLEEQAREQRRKKRQNQPKPKPQVPLKLKLFPHVREEMERKRREREEEEKFAALGRKGRAAQMKEQARSGASNESKKARKNRALNNTPTIENTTAKTKGKKGRKKKKRQSDYSESSSDDYNPEPRRWVTPMKTEVEVDEKVEEKKNSSSKSSEDVESAERVSENAEPVDPAESIPTGNASSTNNNTNDDKSHVAIEATIIPSDTIPKAVPTNPACQILIVSGDCLEAALSLQQITHLSTACLIMASSSQPGGGYRNGACAQEENLFRRTNLLQCLDDPYGMNRNKSFSYPLPEFGGIYVHEAVCFRESESLGYRYYPEGPRLMSFIGVSAYSNPPLESSKKEGDGEVEEEPLLAPNIARKIKRKMTTIFRIARANHHRALVLSAFGCGAYGNPPRHIARLFREVMYEEGLMGSKQRSNGEKKQEECWLQYVVFAVLDDQNAFQSHNPEGNVAGFEKEFRMPALTMMKLQDELVCLEEERQRELERKQEKKEPV